MTRITNKYVKWFNILRNEIKNLIEITVYHKRVFAFYTIVRNGRLTLSLLFHRPLMGKEPIVEILSAGLPVVAHQTTANGLPMQKVGFKPLYGLGESLSGFVNLSRGFENYQSWFENQD